MEQNIKNESQQSQTLDRLCNHLIAAKSYAVLGVAEGNTVRPYGVGTTDDSNWQLAEIPELLPLMAHFDRILVRLDGYSFEAICIRNRLGRSVAPLSLSLEELREVGHTCLKYTGTVQGTKLPVTLQIYEVGDAPHSDIDHLRSLRCIPGFKQKVAVSAWSLNLSTGTVWTNTRFNGLLAGRKFLEKTLTALLSGTGPALNRKSPIGADIRYPVLTYGLVGLMIVMFVIELVLGDFEGVLSPTVESLVAFGGLFRPSVMEDGEWYRLFTAAFLHGGLFHIVLNGIALFMGGLLLESWLGRGWFFTIFSLSILGGSAMSLWMNDPGLVSVGASGGIMGMLATAFMVTFRLPYGQERTGAMTHLLYWLIPALIPLTTSRIGNQIDFAAHFGGAVTGFVIGAVILKTWAPDQPLPRFKRAAELLAVISAIVICVSMVFAFSNRSILQKGFSLSAQIAEDDVFRNLSKLPPDEAESKLIELRKTHPKDPRVMYFSAIFAVDKNQLDDAKAYLERGLAEKEILQHLFTDGKLEAGMRSFLAEILLFKNADAEARAVLKPACGHLSDNDVKHLDAAWVKSVCSSR